MRTGSCSTPNPNSNVEDLDPEYIEKHARRSSIHNTNLQTGTVSKSNASATTNAVSEWLGPRGFHWVYQGKLGGTPKPGLLRDVRLDLKALRRVGVTTLLTFMEQPLSENLPLSDFGIKAFHFPVQDMHAPSFEEGTNICIQISELLENGEVVAAHCKAGLGRTGTMLAAYLIHQGQNAEQAIKRCRLSEPRWIQSEEQVEFLANFEKHLQQAKVA